MKILVIDLETIGEGPADGGVVELGWCEVLQFKVYKSPLSTGPEIIDYTIGESGAHFIDPGMPIPPESSMHHHIIDSDVVGARPFALELGNLLKVREPTVLAAHSAKFEQRFITPDMTGGLPWICTYKCGLRLYPDAPSHSNQGLRYYNKPQGLIREKGLPAHRAEPDAYVTAFHVRDMLSLASVEDLVKWSSEPALQRTCHIGSYRGEKWVNIESSFLRWVADRDFDEDVHYTVNRLLLQRQGLDGEELEAALHKILHGEEDQDDVEFEEIVDESR